MATAFGLLVLALTDADAEAFEFTPAGGELAAVPDAFREWIAKASEECHHPELSPALLAAQLQQESGFRTDRNTVSSADAQGPAQFIPSTWATWGRDEDGNGVADPFDIGDAVMAQGRYMCSLLSDAKTSGYGGDVRALALAGYNAGWGAVEDYKGVPPYTETQNYVRIILASIKDFQGPAPLDVHGSGTGPNALRKAATQLGLPYAYGGGTPNGPSTGFCDGVNGYTSGTCVADDTVGWDCSSLVQYALWPATQLPRTAAAQYGATSSRPVARADLQPGDLMFWRDSSGFIYHVALYADDGNVLHAPRTGQNVKIEAIDTAMPAADYLGATRP
ncbi:C40 family peptidase [Streptomyces sp. JJ66]|nr:C40 family peptidase [Streptomyces sp. JJ66]